MEPHRHQYAHILKGKVQAFQLEYQKELKKSILQYSKSQLKLIGNES